ncbi:IclR family transcriptional regulator C-terminal domain-containing protein [Nesterenkonia sp.]|uniref:IclR family transcriptional regulator domain-containing protein n=1 Tax=Nesterenkonia sp. TaxID=704201 RepID=UPI002604A617|nr:IclR family transcriptional regulator C-terminal domain-containing protein [Nesterenkonia sp.]
MNHHPSDPAPAGEQDGAEQDPQSSSPQDGHPSATPSRNEFVRSLATGLAVLEAFTSDDPRLTLSDVARRAHLNRATARRMLLTLVELGYAYTDGRTFELTPQVLSLGHGYWSGRSWHELLQPQLRELSAKLNESCSAAVLTGDDVMYVSRVHTRRIMRIDLGLGSRLPAFATSMGRVLLADLPPDQLSRRIHAMARPALTAHTVTDPETLIGLIQQVGQDGFALVDQELEVGLRSAAVPVRSAAGRTVLALNTSISAGAESPEQTADRVRPALQRCAQQVEAMIRSLGRDAESLTR